MTGTHASGVLNRTSSLMHAGGVRTQSTGGVRRYLILRRHKIVEHDTEDLLRHATT